MSVIVREHWRIVVIIKLFRHNVRAGRNIRWPPLWIVATDGRTTYGDSIISSSELSAAKMHVR